jgi:hypothetical protein
MTLVTEVGSVTFYRDLPALTGFAESTDPGKLVPMPSDWYFFVTDVVGSTRAIEAGEYRAINLAGAACVTAAFNAVERREMPFIFCGDGAQIACSAGDHGAVWRALHAVSRRVERLNGIQLRVAGFPVGVLRQHGFDLLVGKVRLSDKVHQTVFWGSGLEAVESWIRHGDWALQRPEAVGEPDLTGLECRWSEVPTGKDEVVNFLIQAKLGVAEPEKIYREVVLAINEILGPESARCPLEPERLELMVRPEEQGREVEIRNEGLPGWKKRGLRVWNGLANRLGIFLMRNRIRFLGVDWGIYFDEVIGHSDFQKFNGMIALTVATSTRQREAMVEWLEERYRKGDLVYGLNSSRTTLITCVVLERDRRHFHFVDGSAGGYTAAATDLKRRAREVAGA